MLTEEQIERVNDSYEGEGVRVLDTPTARAFGLVGLVMRSDRVEDPLPDGSRMITLHRGPRKATLFLRDVELIG